MSSDTYSRPRRTGGLTVYGLGERSSITESEKNWDQVKLAAKKVGTLTRISSELNEDAIIAVGDDLAGEIAYAFATSEDDCYFNGDGSSTYFGITGVCSKLKGLSGTIANIAGLQVGTGNAYSELTLNDHIGVVGLLPEFAETPRVVWVMSKLYWANVAMRVAYAVGGTSKADVATPGDRTFLGYPVVISQKMPKTEANSQVCALLGDFSLGTMFGDRRGTTIAFSSEKYFDTDELAVRGTERFDINVHDVGNATATASAKQPGPIVGLITAAS
jgi:HK97 family phage major capsid protein